MLWRSYLHLDKISRHNNKIGVSLNQSETMDRSHSRRLDNGRSTSKNNVFSGESCSNETWSTLRSKERKRSRGFRNMTHDFIIVNNMGSNFNPLSVFRASRLTDFDRWVTLRIQLTSFCFVPLIVSKIIQIGQGTNFCVLKTFAFWNCRQWCLPIVFSSCSSRRVQLKLTSIASPAVSNRVFGE